MPFKNIFKFSNSVQDQIFICKGVKIETICISQTLIPTRKLKKIYTLLGSQYATQYLPTYNTRLKFLGVIEEAKPM